DRAGSPQPATADRDPPSSTLSVAVVQHEQDFAALAPDWEALCSTSNARVYQSFDWQWLWWTHFGSGLALHIVAFRRDGELVGVAPFYVHTDSPCGLGVRRGLRLLGSPVRIRERSGTSMTYDPSDYLDIMVRPGCEDAVGQALAGYLRDHRAAYDVIEVVNTPEDSTVMTVMVPCFRRVGFTVETRPADVCPRLRIPPSVQEYVETRRPGGRRRLHQARRAARRGGAFTIETVADEAETREALQALVRLHQKRWNRLGYPGLFFEDRFQRFVTNVVGSLSRRGRLWLKVARTDGRLIAVRLGFVFNNALYDYLSGFDHDAAAAKRRPGLALLLSMIEDATALKARHIDLLRGDEEYKYELTSEVARNWTIKARIPGTRVADGVQAGLGLLDHLGTRWWRERLILRVHAQQHGMP